MRGGWILAPLRWAGVGGLLLALALVLALAGAAARTGALPGSALRTLHRLLLRLGAGAMLALLGVRVRCLGEVPRGPFVLVSNHLSYLDVAVLASLTPCLFVAKSEVRAWPLLGPIVRDFGTVFLNRDSKVDLPLALAAMEAALAGGDGIVLFPEGTTSDGSRVAPFRSSLLALPARRGLPVHAAALCYATGPGEPSAAEAVCWWGDSAFLPHLARLATLTRIEATLRFAPEPLLERDRKRLAAGLEVAVRKLAFAAAEESSLAAPSEPRTQSAR